MLELCPYEADVSTAIHSGRWDEQLSDHINSCPECRELIDVVRWTRSLNYEAEGPPLRDPDLLWIEARVLRKNIQHERMAKVLAVLDGLSVAVLTGIAIFASRTEVNDVSSTVVIWVRWFGNAFQLRGDLYATALAPVLLGILVVAGIGFVIRPFQIEE
jgi:hypothetical protein